MKKILTLLFILTFCAGSLFSAPRVKIFVQNVTPYDLKYTPSLVPDSCNTTGMNVVPNKTFVYLKAKNFGDTTSITSQTWTFDSKPAGSTAAFVSVPALGWYKFFPDLVGTYTIRASVTTSTGTKDTTMNVYSATYVGTGNFYNVPAVYPNCMSCHASMPAFQTIFNNWKVSGHANRFRYQIDSGSASYSTSCMKCHTVGYDHNKFADNNGFDDKARGLGWVWSAWSPPKAGNWDSLRVKYPSLVAFASIGCESCHGPGSEHALTTDTNKISTTMSPGKCGKCHDSPPNHNIYAQWKNSVHGSGMVFEGRTVADSLRNTFNDCNRCHDGETYIQMTKGQRGHLNTVSVNQEVISCASCHDPHGTTNTASLRDRMTGSDTLAGKIAYPSTVGVGKVCLDCHKARRDPTWYINTRVTSSTWGPHESTQGDMVLGKNAVTFGTPYLSGSHKNISGLCVTCHMATTTDTGTVTRDKVGGHSWNLNLGTYDHVTGCQGCHPGVSSFDDFMAPDDFDGDNVVESWQNEVKGCLSNLGHTLPHTGYDSVSWQQIAADSNNVTKRKAYWNYQYIKNDKSFGMHNPFYAIQVLIASKNALIGINPISTEIPAKFDLAQNYPNPFNPSTKIEFAIAKAGNVTLKIYDITGREIATVLNEKLNPGKYAGIWNAYNSNTGVSSGVYFYRLVANGFTMTKKMVLVK